MEIKEVDRKELKQLKRRGDENVGNKEERGEPAKAGKEGCIQGEIVLCSTMSHL